MRSSMRFSRVFFLVLLPCLFAFAQSSAPAPQTSSSAHAAQTAEGFSVDNIDKMVDPCTDFYQYACGNWLKTAEIPADQPEWVSFIEIDERNKATLRKILEQAAVENPGRSAVEQKIGDYYSSCMDEKAVDAKGFDPLKPELARIAAVKDKAGLIDAVARVHLIGPSPLFRFYSSPDFHNAEMVIAYVDQGGL